MGMVGGDKCTGFLRVQTVAFETKEVTSAEFPKVSIPDEALENQQV